MRVILLLLTVLAAVMSTAAVGSPAMIQAKPGCSSHCRDVEIPYPFGMSEGCYLHDTFFIDCTNSKPILWGNIPVLKISAAEAEIRILNLISQDCYDLQGNSTKYFVPELNLAPNFLVSGTKNKFMAIGCDTSAIITGLQKNGWLNTGCMSFCYEERNLKDDCSGVGCCQTQIPGDLRLVSIRLESYYNHKKVSYFNNCSYAFLVENDFQFSAKYVRGFGDQDGVPMVLDWSVGDETCEVAEKSTSTFRCKENSSCDRSFGGPGYRCKCWPGYEGNPYLDGCVDIDECANQDLNNCTRKCTNIPGGFLCGCPKGYHGDGVRGGTDCSPNPAKANRPKANPAKVVQMSVGIGICSVLTLAMISWLYLILKKRKLIKLKETFFRKNGGIMLQQRLAGREHTSGQSETAKIFTAEELKKATDNYHESRIVGKGGYGTVYRGILADNTLVAIKKSKIVDKTQTAQFINELVVLSQINHRNVVKLLGCCLETEVPLLVYEFVTNGTLFDHVHDRNRGPCMPWCFRLRIAAETAGVLSYLHSAASTPIIHRDIKTTNILLDDSYTAKVSDFGASRFVPMDHMELSTMVQGTLGYLDPEYLHTSQLTEKSDVYSFGVVLVELLTGKKALAFDRPEEERSLAMHFVSCLKEDRLFDMVESQMADEANREQIRGVALVAKSCLKLKGEERPTMKEVAMELEGLRSTEKHPWDCVESESNTEETHGFINLNALKGYGYGDGNFRTSSGYDISQRSIMSSYGYGR